MNYLIIAPAWIGDMVMSQSLYRYLKQLHPQCKIDLVCNTACAQLTPFMPEINRTHILDIPHGTFGFKLRKTLGKSLKSCQYTHAIILPNSWKSALVPFFANIKIRIGFLGEFRHFLLTHSHKLNKQRYPLMIERFCALAHLKTNQLPPHTQDIPLPYPFFQFNFQTKVAAEPSLSTNQYILICPGAEYGPAKRWPSQYYREIAKKLLLHGYDIKILGAQKEYDIAQAITDGLESSPKTKFDNLAGKTNLSEVIQLMNHAACIVSNDSGLMHIANALNKPVVIIYGSSSTQFTPPLNARAIALFRTDLACRPCFKRTCQFSHYDCLSGIKPETVLKKIKEVLN